ncbi:transposase [bacterium]|nr:transposase [bacterium]
MSRIARAVIVDVPYHVTHRGIRESDVFYTDHDRRHYLDDLANRASDRGLDIWGWCLMTNHVHLVVVPRKRDALASVIGHVHQRHAMRINKAHEWRGHLWADRFYSTPLDEAHLWAAIKYVELNPVRAGLARYAEEWLWSSARAHCGLKPATGSTALPAVGSPFGGTHPHPLHGRPISWSDWLRLGLEAEALDRLRRATMTGRPCGSAEFACGLEAQLGRNLTPQRRGRKPAPIPDQPVATEDLLR